MRNKPPISALFKPKTYHHLRPRGDNSTSRIKSIQFMPYVGTSLTRILRFLNGMSSIFIGSSGGGGGVACVVAPSSKWKCKYLSGHRVDWQLRGVNGEQEGFKGNADRLL